MREGRCGDDDDDDNDDAKSHPAAEITPQTFYFVSPLRSRS